MPKIQDYGAPQRSLEPGLQRSNADLMPDGEIGKAFAQIGDTISDVGAAKNRRQEQEDVSELNAKFSDLQYGWDVELDDRMQKGTIDAEKVREEVQEQINKIGESATTTAGKSYFTKMQARARGRITLGATKRQSVLAGNQAVEKMETAHQKRSGLVTNNPSSFVQAIEDSNEAIDQQVAVGGLPAKVAEKLKHKYAVDLAQNSIRGWANLSPEEAKAKMQSSEFAGYLSGDMQKELNGYIATQISAREADEQRKIRAEEKFKKDRTEKKMGEWLPLMMDDQLDPNKVAQDQSIPYDERVKIIDRIAKQRKENFTEFTADAFYRINLPENDPNRIQTIGQLLAYANKDGKRLDINNINQMQKMLDDSEPGKRLKAARLQVLSVAKGSGGILQKDLGLTPTGGGITFSSGGFSAESQRQLSQFLIDVQAEEERVAKEGKDVFQTLYNPGSKEYVGSAAFMSKYRISPAQQLQNAASLKIQNPVQFQLNNPAAPAVNEKKNMIKPGESLLDWKKRTGR